MDARPGRVDARDVLPAPLTEERGVALVEALVAAVLLVAIALGVLPMVNVATSQSAATQKRSVAASLMGSEEQRLRALSAIKSLDGYEGTRTIASQGTTYTVASRADLVRDASGLVSCTTDATGVDYLHLQTTVTWSGLSTPMHSEALLNTRLGEVGPTIGTLVTQVTKADGTPISGLNVTAAGKSDQTNDAGCVVFGFLNEGAATVSASVPGYVTPTGASAVAQPATVVGGQTAKADVLYDQAGTVPVAFSTVNPLTRATSTATEDTFSLSNPGLTVPRILQSSSGPRGSFTVPSVFPFSGTYGVYAGGCTGNDPTTYDQTYGDAHPESQVLARPGTTTATVTARIPTLAVTVKSASGSTLSGANVVLTPDTSKPAMQDCPGDRTLGTSATGGVALVQAPFGSYSLCVSSGKYQRLYGGVDLTTAANGAAVSVTLPSSQTSACPGAPT